MRIACVLADGFEESELRVPLNRLREAGHEVVLIGDRAGRTIRGKRGVEQVKADLSIDDADVQDFDALLIPGGRSPDHLRGDPRFVDFARDFDRAGKLIAAVCHGPQLLMTAGLVKGRELTAWPTVQGDLKLAGAQVIDDEVIIDRNWITSRRPEDLEAFSSAILDWIGRHEAAGAPTS